MRKKKRGYKTKRFFNFEHEKILWNCIKKQKIKITLITQLQSIFFFFNLLLYIFSFEYRQHSFTPQLGRNTDPQWGEIPTRSGDHFGKSYLTF